MASASSMGGLYATVNLDTTQALKALRQLRTEFERALKPTQTAGAQAGKQLQTATQGTRKELDKAAESGNRLNKSLRDSGKSAQGLKDQVSGVGKQLNQGLVSTLSSFGAAKSGNVFFAMATALRGITTAMGGVTAASGGTAAAVAAVVVVIVAGIAAAAAWAAALKKLTEVSIQSGATLEQLYVSLEALLGSQKRAAEEVAFIVQAAKLSPYFTDAVIALDRFLLAQGMLDDNLRRKTLQNLLNFGAAAGISGDALKDLARALGQVVVAGRLTGEEARQLRNNMVQVEQVIRLLPEYANASGQAIKDAMEKGEISSQEFITAWLQFTDQFDGAAQKMQNTVLGLRDTIIDTFQLGLGAAALELDDAFSPLAAVRGVLSDVLALVNQIDFRPMVAGLGALLQGVLGPVANWIATQGPNIVNFFNSVLPRAILTTANFFLAWWSQVRVVWNFFVFAVRGVWVAVTAFFRGFTSGANASLNPIKLIAGAFAVAATVIIGALGVVGATATVVWGVIAAGAIAVSTLIRNLFAFFTGADTSGIGEGMGRAADALAGSWSAAAGILSGAATSIQDSWAAVSGLEPIKLPEFAAPDVAIPEVGAIGADAFPGMVGEGDGGGAAGAAKKAADDMAKAMDVLYDLTRRWFGTRSELEKGLLGSEGFEATIDQIVGMGKRLLEAAADIGNTNLSSTIDKGVRDLLKLAAARDAAAEALKEAEKNLNDALRERDAFVAKVKEGALAFANAFKTETETVRSFEQFSERGFFYETETTKQKSFIDSLRERVAAMKKFVADVKKLGAAGLDKGLLESIVAAGPEQAGEVAAQLAAGGDAMISEVNGLQQAATRVADELGEFGATQFHQAGVDMAQATVDGLTSDIAAIEAQAKAITDKIYAAVLPFAEQMKEVGTAGAGGMGEGIASGTPAIDAAMGGVVGVLDTGLGAGVGAFGDFNTGSSAAMDTAIGNIADGFGRMGDAMGTEIDEWKKILFPEGKSFAQGLFDLIWNTIKNHTWLGSVLNWWNGTVVPFWEAIFDFLKNPTIEGIISAISHVVSWLANLSPITWFLPFNINASKVRDILIDAINWVIKKYNSIAFLPDISLLTKGGGGGQMSSGGGVSYTLPSSASYGGGGAYTPNIYIGGEKLYDHIDYRIQENNGAQNTYVAQGRGNTSR